MYIYAWWSFLLWIFLLFLMDDSLLGCLTMYFFNQVLQEGTLLIKSYKLKLIYLDRISTHVYISLINKKGVKGTGIAQHYSFFVNYTFTLTVKSSVNNFKSPCVIFGPFL